MRRIATYLNALSNYRAPIGILAVLLIVSNVIVAVGFTGYYSLIPFVNHSAKISNTSLISTKQVSLQGREYEILTSAQGLTLYYSYFLGSDIPKTACTGECTTTWHPLLITDTSAIMAVKPELRGQLTAVANTNGLQVQYNGRFLYTYSGDEMPGQMNGNGLTLMDIGAVAKIAVYSLIPLANQSTENAGTPLIGTIPTSIHGKGYEVLANAQGLTLYYSEGDVCTGECTTTWHPLLATSMSALISSTSNLPPAMQQNLAAVPGPNGLQVQYIGHFLYTYSGDREPGDINGLNSPNSINGIWEVQLP